jgi:hypothetical protein
MDTAEAQRFLAEDSGNVDDAGNFSIQVLNTALMRSHNLQLVQDSSNLRRALEVIDSDTNGGGGDWSSSGDVSVSLCVFVLV